MMRALWAALALVCFVAGWTVRGWREGAADRVAIAERVIQTAALQRQADMEAVNHEQELQDMEARAVAADTALRRLQQSLVTFNGSDPGTPGSGNGASVVGEILGDCAAEYRRLAGEADQLRARLVTLQNWTRSVTP